MVLKQILTIFTLLFLSTTWANEELCEKIGGDYHAQKNSCYCYWIEDYVDPLKENASKLCLGEMASIAGKIQLISSMNNSTKKCFIEDSVAKEIANPNISCPYWMHSKLNDYRENGWIIDSPKKMCKIEMSIKNDPFTSYKDLEHYLATNSSTTVEAPSNMFSKCLRQRNTINGGEDFSDKERKLLVVEYYTNSNRLKNGRLAAIEAVASIDSLLDGPPQGDSFWSKHNNTCEDKHITSSIILCRHHKNKCKPKGGLDSLALEVKDAFLFLKELDDSNESEQKKSEYRAVFEQLYPWLKGSTFKKLIRDNGANAKYALKRQLQESRKKNISRLSKFKKATACLNSHVKDPSICDGLEETIKEAPLFSFEVSKLEYDEKDNLISSKAEQDDFMKSFFTKGYQDTLSCVQSIKKERDFSDSAIHDFAIDSALTIGTMGLGSVAAGSKAIISSASAGGKLAKVATKAKNFKNFLKTPRGMAYASLSSIDLSRSVKAMTYSMIDACSVDLDSSSSTHTSLNTCPDSISDRKGTNTSSDFRKCLLTGIISGAALTLPYTSKVAFDATKRLSSFLPIVSRLDIKNKKIILDLKKRGIDPTKVSFEDASRLSDEERRAISQYLSLKVTGKKLSDTQLDAVIRAHEIGEEFEHLGFYTQKSIGLKGKTLASAGISKELRKSLLDNGIAGKSLTLEKYIENKKLLNQKIKDLLAGRNTSELNPLETSSLKELLTKVKRLDEIAKSFSINPSTNKYDSKFLNAKINEINSSIISVKSGGDVNEELLEKLRKKRSFWENERLWSNGIGKSSAKALSSNELEKLAKEFQVSMRAISDKETFNSSMSTKFFDQLELSSKDISNGQVLGGRSNALKVTVDNQESVVMKMADADGVNVDGEVAAYLLDKDIFGLGVIPPAKKVQVEQGEAVVSAFVKNSYTDDALAKLGHLKKTQQYIDDQASVNALNYIYGNKDFTSENVLNVVVKENGVNTLKSQVGIDFGQGFGRYRSPSSDGVFKSKGTFNQQSKKLKANPEDYIPRDKGFIQRVRLYSESPVGKRMFMNDVRDSLSKSDVNLSDEAIENMYDRVRFLNSFIQGN
jgi:hypothetical protein